MHLGHVQASHFVNFVEVSQGFNIDDFQSWILSI